MNRYRMHNFKMPAHSWDVPVGSRWILNLEGYRKNIKMIRLNIERGRLVDLLYAPHISITIPPIKGDQLPVGYYINKDLAEDMWLVGDVITQFSNMSHHPRNQCLLPLNHFYQFYEHE